MTNGVFCCILKLNLWSIRKGNELLNEKDMTEVRLSGEKIFDGRVIRVERDTVRLPDGARATREVVRHPGAVCVVPLTDKNEVLLVR